MQLHADNKKIAMNRGRH